jgi:hypothetical protein
MRGALLARIGLAVVASIALAVPASASGESPPATEPTVSIEKACDLQFPQPEVIHNWISSITDFPSGTTVLGTQEVFDHVTGTFLHPDQVEFMPPLVVPFGYFHPVTVFLTVEWEGGTLTATRYINCDEPGSKEDCKKGGWRDYPEFKNQGQCLTFVRRNPSPPAPEPAQ